MMTAAESEIMSEMRQARRLLELTQLDVYAETGIQPGRLSAAESGRRALSEPEVCLLRMFLKKRLLAMGQVQQFRRQEELTGS